MTMILLRSPAAAVLVALVFAACGGASRGVAPQGATAPSTAAEYEALYLARLDSARARYTEADVRFMSDMIHHHAQALEMAEMVPERTDNPAIRTLAARIINAQTDEIAIMRRWLEDRGEPVPPMPGDSPAGGGAAHGAGEGEHAHAEAHPEMPGMLTPEELHHLAQARGAAFDRLFLSSMIRHHQGAVTMVRELFATDGAGQDEEAFKFASDAQVDQATEVARMEGMLADLVDSPAAH